MKVQDILTDEGKWTKQLFARDKLGNNADPDSDNAVCWCILGAVRKCYPSREDQVIVLDKLYEKFDNITIWNDDPERTFPEVRALIEELDI